MACQSQEVALFDALGNSILRLEMQNSQARFSQIRLVAGDYLICWRSPGPGCKGTGSYHAPNSKLLADELPERPQLDDILSRASDLGEIATPRFSFSAR